MLASSAPARQALAPGAARLRVDLVDGASAVTGNCARNPARLLTPRHRGAAVWCFTTSFGGGLVAGDHLDLDVALAAGATALLATQASTKVYHSVDGALARQDLEAAVASDAFLVNLPAHVTCFRDARFRARNRYCLNSGASLLALDWYSAGREAHGGERWAFAQLHSSVELIVDDQLVLREAVELSEAAGLPALGNRMGRFAVWGNLVLWGPRCAALSAGLQSPRSGLEKGGDWVASVSPLAEGCILRFAAVSVEAANTRLRAALVDLIPQLGGDPWARTF
ncbi:MAG: urease accessory protein UreD [Planctomycetota bacterium]|jgi:urease accessory protein|nr:urease accessory protein UreD [Planctomycetota bacterium]